MLFITGHKGFVGRHLVKRCEEKNLPYRGYDIEESGDDIRDLEKLKAAMQENEYTAVIHLAAKSGARDGELYPDEYITTNVNGTRNVLAAAADAGINTVIAFSSSAVYGPQPSPKHEAQQMTPQNIYGATKVAGEALIYAMPGVSQRILIRPFVIYGEDGRPDGVIYKWINQIKNGEPVTFYGDGTSKRGYTYVGDLIDGVFVALEKCAKEELQGVHRYNLGGSEIITLDMLHQLFKEHSPIPFETKRTERAANDIKESWADLTKAKEELGYEPKTVFAEKIKEIIQSELGESA